MRALVVLILSLLIVSWVNALDFPGRAPGTAQASQKDGVFTLSNSVISQSWHVVDGTLRPLSLNDELTKQTFDQSGHELFRLATKEAVEPKQSGATFVAIRLEDRRVVALCSGDGNSWSELASFPRKDLAGEPKIVRLGKMNLKAESKDYAAEAGAVGTGTIRDIAGHDPFTFTSPANRAATTEFDFPTGTKVISCRIDKGSDQGMSWAPAMALVWEEGKRFVLIGVRDKSHFNVTTDEGEQILQARGSSYPTFDLNGSTFKLVGAPAISDLPNTPGKMLSADLVSDAGLTVHWQAMLRDGSNYIRQSIELKSAKPMPLTGVEFVDLALPDAKTIGTCPGSPVVGGDIFAGVEMPGAENSVSDTGARVGFACKLQLSADQSYEFGSVVGVAVPGQLRRSFLYYIERERARPSSPFLHYNCWYDFAQNVTADKLLDAVNQIKEQLGTERGVPVQSYLIDDGWDDSKHTFWQEDQKKFPGGFTALHQKMGDAHMSIWISPLGGYGERPLRTAAAKKLGLIPDDAQLDFSIPKYKQWFQDRCLQLMREDGVNAFKWDKAGDGVSPHFMALLDVAKYLRAADPKLFINVTVGTWPSPFWLNHIDSTWRNGSADVGWAGKGDDREQWITYRDGYIHKLFVQQGPLYPLNSIMAHGVVLGRCYQGARVAKAGPNLRNEVRSYFAIGTSLQELYITPSLMNDQGWDDVAASAKWAQDNADVLVDSHWVGGDPLKLEPYGYAAWSPKKCTLMIRNPDDAAKTISLDAAMVFDLPANAPKHYMLKSAYVDQRAQDLELTAGEPKSVELQPFEVLVFESK